MPGAGIADSARARLGVVERARVEAGQQSSGDHKRVMLDTNGHDRRRRWALSDRAMVMTRSVRAGDPLTGRTPLVGAVRSVLQRPPRTISQCRSATYREGNDPARRAVGRNRTGKVGALPLGRSASQRQNTNFHECSRTEESANEQTQRASA